jgi:hypothetical protein
MSQEEQGSNDHCILVDSAVIEYDDDGDPVTEYETLFYEFCANEDINATAAAASYLNYDAKELTITGDRAENFWVEKCNRCSDNCPGRAAKAAGKA